MRRDIAAHVHPLLAPILLGIRESLIKSAIVEVVLEFVGEVGILCTLVLRPPGEAVVVQPLALEGLAVPCPRPELRLLEENGIYAGVYHRLDVAFLEISEVVPGGNDIRNEAAVPDGVALHRLLPFIEVPLAVPLTREIVLIVAPGYACHEVGGVASLPPRLHSLAEGHAAVVVGPIDHHEVGANVCDWLPRTRGLKRCFLLPQNRQGTEEKDGSKSGFHNSNSFVVLTKDKVKHFPSKNKW